MAGVLHYNTFRKTSRRGQVYGLLSSCIASVVFSIPIAVLLLSFILQRAICSPTASMMAVHIARSVLDVPMLAIVALPCVGLFFASMSVYSKRHQHDMATVGLVINFGALLAGLTFFIQQLSNP